MRRVVPFVAALLLLAPLGLTVWLAFSPDAFFSLPVQDASTRWFGLAVGDERWRGALLRSVWMAGLSGLVAVGLALLAGLSIRQGEKPWWLVALLLPACIPHAAWAMGLLAWVGQLPGWAGVWVLVLAHAVLGVPVAFLVLRLRLDGTHHALLATARGLGAGPVAAWWRVGLPRLVPALAVGFLLAGTLALHEPVLGLFLCPPGGETLAALAWPTLRSSLTPVVAAVATLTLLMGLGVAGAVVWLWGLERRRGRGPDGRVAGD